MANRTVHLPVAPLEPLGGTLRKDIWWAGPAATILVLSSFIVYATWRAFEGSAYQWGAYLSPFYSPLLDVGWARKTGLAFLTPAMLILPGPASFRFTCYYYRKAYYRAFAMDPPACAVGERNAHSYNGEKKLLVIQNLHRFAMYLAVLFLVFLWHDFIKSLSFDGHFGLGLGSLVLLTNCTLLSGYTFGCHSFRHLIGGSVDSFSEAPLGKLRHSLWNLVTKLNGNHMAFAWSSLFGVALTDLYIR